MPTWAYRLYLGSRAKGIRLRPHRVSPKPDLIIVARNIKQARKLVKGYAKKEGIKEWKIVPRSGPSSEEMKIAQMRAYRLMKKRQMTWDEAMREGSKNVKPRSSGIYIPRTRRKVYP